MTQKTPQRGDMTEMTEKPTEKAEKKQNFGHVPQSPDSPPHQEAPTPGEDVDSTNGLPSGRGRNAELNKDPVQRKDEDKSDDLDDSDLEETEDSTGTLRDPTTRRP